MLASAVAVTYCRLICSRQSSYVSPNIPEKKYYTVSAVRKYMTIHFILMSEANTKRNIQFENSPPSASLGMQGPPESARMRGFTARMYAIVRNVAVAPASSVVNVLPRSF